MGALGRVGVGREREWGRWGLGLVKIGVDGGI